MSSQDAIIIADYAEPSVMTLDELCGTCRVKPQLIEDLIHHEIISPIDPVPPFLFDLSQLQRLKTALRLLNDLEVNLMGVAIIIDLLTILEKQRIKTEVIKKHFEQDQPESGSHLIYFPD